MSEHIIEISGVDYIGKTTQASLLTYGAHVLTRNMGGLGAYSEGFPDSQNKQECWGWWFEDTTLRQIGGTIISAYNARLAQAEASPHAYVSMERGATMSKAQLTANFATRRETDIDNVVDEIDAFVGPRLRRPEAGTVREVVLFGGSDMQNKPELLACKTFGRTSKEERDAHQSAQNDFYDQYQKNLAVALLHYTTEESSPTTFRVDVNDAAVDVQNAIRSHASLSDINLKPLLDDDAVYLGLAGLSESGKSQVAVELANNNGFTRFKLGFFNQLHQSNEVYAPPTDVARSIVRFLAGNPQIKKATFESFHNPKLSAELKLLLGRRWYTVLVDATPETRAARLQQQFPEIDPAVLEQQQAGKDTIKSQQSVQAHDAIADIKVDNNGSLESTMKQIIKGIAHD
jgi:dephospho-CoA kinase